MLPPHRRLGPRSLGWALALLLPLAALAEAPEKQLTARIARELAAYAKDKVQPDYPPAIAQLAAEDAATRRAAGQYLRRLIEAARAAAEREDHPSRQPIDDYEAHERAIPFVTLSYSISETLSDASDGDEALEPAAALLACDPEDAFAFQVVMRTRTPRGDAMVRAILDRPESHADLVPAAIEEALARALPVEAEIRRLAMSYDGKIRQAARAAAARMKWRNLPAYTPVQAFTPALEAALRDIAAMVPDAIPPNAKWVRASVRDQRRKKEDYGYSGWLLAQDGRESTMLDYTGRKVLVVPGEFPDHRVMPPVDAVIARGIIQPRTLKEEAKFMAAIRADEHRFERGGELFPGYALRPYFEAEMASSITKPEALVAAWSFQRGDRATAAAILFPRLQEMSVPAMLRITAQLLGAECDDRMIDALSARRLPEALGLARHLAQPIFREYAPRGRARELAEQLARRAGDFQTFRLPTEDEWDRQKLKLGRGEQVRFLAEHLRLLQCPLENIYFDRPSYMAPQFAEVSWEGGGWRWRDPVINPYRELRTLDLHADELPLLIPFLNDEQFSLTYSSRDPGLFPPYLGLHRVNQIVARVIQFIAHRDLVQWKTYDPLDQAGREERRAELEKWVDANGAKTAEELLLETLRQTKDWEELASVGLDALARKLTSALPVLAARLGDFSEPTWEMIAELCSRFPGAEHSPVIHRWLKEENESLRFWGALALVSRGGVAEQEEAIKVLRPLLDPEAGSGRDRLAQAYGPLMDSKSEAVQRMAEEIALAQNPLYRHAQSMLLQFLHLGRKAIFEALLQRLADQTTSIPSTDGHGSTWPRPFTPALATAEMLIYTIPNAPSYPLTKKTERQLIEMGKKWLREQLAMVEAGKEPEIGDQEPPSADSSLDERFLE